MVSRVSVKTGLLGALGAVALAAVCGWLWSLRSSRPDVPSEMPRKGGPISSEGGAAASQHSPPATPPLTWPALPPLPPNRFQNSRADVAYVGSETCAECHPDEHEWFSQTPHSRSLGDVDPAAEPPDGTFDHGPSGRSYAVYRAGDELRHAEKIRSEDGQELTLADHPLRYVVGSGAHARTYLIEKDGFLAESPVTWYASRQQWAMSPGFENYNPSFGRAVYVDCMFCHAGRVEAIGGNRSRVAIHAQAIDCERCHGPGGLHVDYWNSSAESPADGDLTIVNPARLARDEKEAICAQCHLDSAAAADVRGRGMHQFRPGYALREFHVHFTLAADRPMTVVGHVEQMRLSPCYQNSPELTCITCHATHAEPIADKVDYYRARCLACHDPHSCGLDAADRLRQSPRDDCGSCHMPPSATEVPHVAATHHRIGIHAPAPPEPTGNAAATLVPLDDLSHLPAGERERCLGLAYLKLSKKETDAAASETYRQRARDMLERLRAGGLQDHATDAALAEIYQRPDPQKSIMFAEAVLAADDAPPPVRVQALFALSNSLVNLGRTDLAISPLEQLVTLRRQAGDWFVLGVCRYQAGDVEGALKAAHQAAEMRPDTARFQALLAELYTQAGRNDVAGRHEQRARQLAAAQAAAERSEREAHTEQD